MRDVTRNLLFALVAVAVLLLALGALPSFLRTGDPYYVTASPADGDHEAANASDLPDRSYPYVTGALADAAAADGAVGRSDPYYRGPFGVKETFTHSPFDEMGAIRTRYPKVVENETAYVTSNGTRYELTVARGEPA